MAEEGKAAAEESKSGEGSSGAGEEQKSSTGAESSGEEAQPKKYTFDGVSGEFTEADVKNIILGNKAKKTEIDTLSTRLKELEDKNLSDDEKKAKEQNDLKAENARLKEERKLSRIEVALASAGVKPKFAKLIEVDSLEEVAGAVSKFVEENPELVAGKNKKPDVKVPDESSQGESSVSPKGSDKLKEIEEMYAKAQTDEDLKKADAAYDEFRQVSSERVRRRL